MGEFHSIFADSNVQLFGLPLIASLFYCWYIARIKYGAWGLYASAGIAMAFITSYVALRGLPVWPPQLTDSFLPWIVGGGAILGLMIDIFDLGPNLRNLIYLLLAIALSFGFGTLINGTNTPTFMLIRYGVFIGVGYLIFSRMDEEQDNYTAAPLAALLCLGAMLAVTLIYTSRYSLFISGLLAAVAGFVLINWPRVKMPWGATGTLAVGSGIISIMAILGLPMANYLLPPLSLSMLCFAVPMLMRFLPSVRPSLQPVLQIALSSPLIYYAGILTYDHM